MKLIYFDFGGRGEPIRLAFRIGNVAFEDERIAPADWPGRKAEMPLGAMPVLEVNGIRLVHSNTILRYVGLLGGLYPNDPLQAALCDQLMETVEEIMTRLVSTMRMQDDERRLAREDLCRDALPFYLAAIAEMTGESFAVGDSLTVADLKLAQFIQMLSSGMLDHVPTDLVSRTSPKLLALDEFISTHPQVVAHSA